MSEYLKLKLNKDKKDFIEALGATPERSDEITRAIGIEFSYEPDRNKAIENVFDRLQPKNIEEVYLIGAIAGGYDAVNILAEGFKAISNVAESINSGISANIPKPIGRES